MYDLAMYAFSFLRQLFYQLLIVKIRYPFFGLFDWNHYTFPLESWKLFNVSHAVSKMGCLHYLHDMTM